MIWGSGLPAEPVGIHIGWSSCQSFAIVVLPSDILVWNDELQSFVLERLPSLTQASNYPTFMLPRSAWILSCQSNHDEEAKRHDGTDRLAPQRSRQRRPRERDTQ